MAGIPGLNGATLSAARRFNPIGGVSDVTGRCGFVSPYRPAAPVGLSMSPVLF
jgi:hypothetical protein